MKLVLCLVVTQSGGRIQTLGSPRSLELGHDASVMPRITPCTAADKRLIINEEIRTKNSGTRWNVYHATSLGSRSALELLYGARKGNEPEYPHDCSRRPVAPIFGPYHAKFGLL